MGALSLSHMRRVHVTVPAGCRCTRANTARRAAASARAPQSQPTGGDHVRRTRASAYTCALVLGTLFFPHETSGGWSEKETEAETFQ
jgi:hypothetical protein